MRFRHELLVFVCLQDALDPVKHQSCAVSLLNTVRRKRVNPIDTYQNDFTGYVDGVVAPLYETCINAVVYDWVLKQKLVRRHLDEKYVPQIAVVLRCIFCWWRIVVIVAVVVADGWQNWNTRDVLNNHLDYLLHGVKHEIPVWIRCRRVVLTKAVSHQVSWHKHSSVCKTLIFSLLLCALQHNFKQIVIRLLARVRHIVSRIDIEVDIIDN